MIDNQNFSWRTDSLVRTHSLNYHHLTLQILHLFPLYSFWHLVSHLVY